MSFLNYLRKRKKNIADSNISKQITISITNGDMDELSKENEDIIYKALYKKKRQILVDLDNAINLYSIKHIINKKDKFAEVEYCCKICMENPINIVIKSCGHMFCRDCINKSNGICFNCRGAINEVINIYS